jgi:hypothetical protein
MFLCQRGDARAGKRGDLQFDLVGWDPFTQSIRVNSTHLSLTLVVVGR